MTLQRRIQRLEDAGGGAESCEECGGPPKPGDCVEYEIVWKDVPELSDADDPGPTHCPGCSRQLVYEVSWGEQT